MKTLSELGAIAKMYEKKPEIPKNIHMEYYTENGPRKGPRSHWVAPAGERDGKQVYRSTAQYRHNDGKRARAGAHWGDRLESYLWDNSTKDTKVDARRKMLSRHLANQMYNATPTGTDTHWYRDQFYDPYDEHNVLPGNQARKTPLKSKTKETRELKDWMRRKYDNVRTGVW